LDDDLLSGGKSKYKNQKKVLTLHHQSKKYKKVSCFKKNGLHGSG